MTTRVKAGVFKPRKTYTTTTLPIPHKPSTIKDIISSPIWFQAMQDEYVYL